MHVEAHEYVARSVWKLGNDFGDVVEFGSRNVNGSVKSLFNCNSYYGIDIAPGPDVDEVADAAEWSSREKVDAIVCCEVLEHTPAVAGILASARLNLHDGGILIVTCATDPRAPHSAVDGGPLRDEYYGNVDPEEFRLLLDGCNFEVIDMEVWPQRGDLYVTAIAR